MNQSLPGKVLVVDDNPDFQEDFRKLFYLETDEPGLSDYVIETANYAETAIEMVKKAILVGSPYSVILINISISTELDGFDIAQHIWDVDAKVQIIVCPSPEYNWKETAAKLKVSDNLIILKKPLNMNEIRQSVVALSTKWELQRQLQYQYENLNNEINLHTAELKKTLSYAKATLDATPEGVLAISNDQKIITYNKTLLQLWNTPEKVFQTDKPFDIYKKLSKKAEESKLFLKMLMNLFEETEEFNTSNEWKMKNGKILELYKERRYLKNKTIICVLSFKDVTDRKRLEEQLVYQATHDSLTGLPNRILLSDRVQQAIAYAKRQETCIGILLFDLDNFKDINDTLGHDTGDLLLQAVAERLTQNVRDIDTAIRLGGDEFIVILASQPRAEDSLAKAKEFLELFMQPFQINDHMFTLTTSIGISYYPDDGQEAETLLKNADAALYQAKRVKNTYQVYMSEFNEPLLQRAELNSELLHALERDEFVLHYQPMIKSETGKIIGLEALLRWQHPTLGLLYPQTFIRLAEETGLIAPIGEWVLKEACTQIKLWQNEIDPNLFVGVNISGYQFAQKNFLEIVKKTLELTHIPANSLELDMSQNSGFKNVLETSQKMLQLKEIGVRLAIDDFGVEDASFAYLKYFPFDKIKIDRSFINGIRINKYDSAIVEAIISMAKKMGMEVLAVGVENPEQVEFLLKNHGGQLQGYYYSSPLDASSCTELLRNEKFKAEKVVK